MKSPLLLAFLMPLFVGCSVISPCGNDISQTAPSPDGTYKAVVFSRDCGATTGFSTQISVLLASQSLPDNGGNVLILDDNLPISLKWKDANTLLIHYPQTARSFNKQTAVGNVRIIFE